MSELMEILRSVRRDIDFEKEKALIDDGLLDSVDVLAILSGIKAGLGVEIPISELDPDDFNSAETIARCIERKTHGQD